MTTALDLYRGAGGWSVACQRLGVDDLGVENNLAANATAEAAGFATYGLDVWTMTRFEAIVAGLIGSPPCQPFSAAGKRTGRAHLDAICRQAAGDVSTAALRTLGVVMGDERAAHVLMPLTYVRDLRPAWVALEQVPAVLPIWEAIAERLRRSGYHAVTGVLHAEQYGVPQTRRRAVLMAHRDREVALPTPTHSRYYPRNPPRLDDGVLPWVSMASALGWGLSGSPSPTITGGGTATGGAEPIAHISHRYTDRPDWSFRRPSTTIVGTFRPEVVAAPKYRTTVSRQNEPDSVRVTVEEAGVLQSFPADYPWQGSRSARYLQVGNAIPPLLAGAILRELVTP